MRLLRASGVVDVRAERTGAERVSGWTAGRKVIAHE
jgi:hypothetical protein